MMKLLDLCELYGVNDRARRTPVLKKAIKGYVHENALFLICFYDTWLRGKTTMAKGLLDVFIDPGDYGNAPNFDAMEIGQIDIGELNLSSEAPRQIRAAWDGNVAPFLARISDVLMSDGAGSSGGAFREMMEQDYNQNIATAVPDDRTSSQYAVLCQKFTEKLGPYGFDRAYSCL